MTYRSKELQFQAIRQEVHKALMNFELRVSDDQIRDQGRSDNHAGVIHYLPPRANVVQYDKRGLMRVYRPERSWVPTLDNTVTNLYDVVSHGESDVYPSTGELEVMAFKFMRDWRYDTLGPTGGDDRGDKGDYDFGFLDEL